MVLGILFFGYSWDNHNVAYKCSTSSVLAGEKQVNTFYSANMRQILGVYFVLSEKATFMHWQIVSKYWKKYEAFL